MAQDDAGRAQLYQQHRVPGRAISAMADEDALTDARESLQRIVGHCREDNVQIIGPENYPKNLLAKGRMPTVMFLQSNDPEGFRDLSKATALVGDHESTLLAPMARQAAEVS